MYIKFTPSFLIASAKVFLKKQEKEKSSSPSPASSFDFNQISVHRWSGLSPYPIEL